ncbi:unannotated protein [freshwater metagenome]|uniref:Unannotated protein n=1 Tax=freshwater metagenome TaxID=449393 RepID=A0A6J5ZD50_9ZZZZ|nr:hypothetical protein [Actinomycetota bacterium]
MTRLDALPADQTAVLSLLLGQQKSYGEISEALGLSEAAVSERAYAALSALAEPEKAPGGKRRAEICDYLLGQQSPADEQKTRAALGRSASDRAWARAAAAPLSEVAGATLAVIPGADGPEPLERSDVSFDSTDEFPASPAGRPRGGVLVLAAVALLIAIGAGFAIGRVTGGSESSSASSNATSGTTASATTATAVAQAALKPPAGAPAPKAVGVAEISLQANNRILSAVAKSLPAAPNGSQYGVWLTADGKAPVWLGYFQAIDKSGGGVALQGTLNGDPKAYSGVLVTLEKTASTPTNPSATYLLGPLRFSAS